jgi:hypothetical protein
VVACGVDGAGVVTVGFVTVGFVTVGFDVPEDEDDVR